MAADTTTSRGPDARFLVAHPAHFIALGFGAGLFPKAPGTAGTLLALAIYWALVWLIPPLAIAMLAVPLFFLGIWACGVTGRDLGVEDHGSMVWDEVVAFLPLAAMMHASIWMQLVAFGIFRGFDILKPPPIRYFEKNLRGGLGVMFDDLIAASYTFAVMIVLAIGGQKLLRELAA